jgi:hypothetical protein
MVVRMVGGAGGDKTAGEKSDQIGQAAEHSEQHGVVAQFPVPGEVVQHGGGVEHGHQQVQEHADGDGGQGAEDHRSPRHQRMGVAGIDGGGFNRGHVEDPSSAPGQARLQVNAL